MDHDRSDPRRKPLEPSGGSRMESLEEEIRLEALAEKILEGSVVDWPEVEASAKSDRERAVLKELRNLDRVTSFHRSAQRGDRDVNGVQASLERWGPLEIIRRIGEGSFGEVYEARDPQLDRHVALKLLRSEGKATEVDPQAKTRSPDDLPPAGIRVTPDMIIKEGRLLAKINHPNVVKIHGADDHEGRVGIWMELVRGATLSSIVEERGRFGAGEVVALGRDLCGALAAVHAAGIIHRDIKAQNVMREEGGKILLMDFGIGAEENKSRDNRSVAGTALYLAPERFRGVPSTIRSDIYSLGVLLYYLLTGQFPVTAASLAEIIAAHEAGNRVYLRDLRPDLPRPLVKLIERATALDPMDRFGSAGEMERALDLEVTVSAEPPEITKRSPRRFILGTIVSVVIVFAAIGVWFHARSGYDVQATFLRRTEDGGLIALAPKDSVQVGDGLSLSLKGTKDLYVYVINREETGRMYLLFPHPALDLQNPLPADAYHRLPGSIGGEKQDWEVSSAGGREQFLLVTSPERLSEFEADIKDLARPQLGEVGGYAMITGDVLTRGVQKFMQVPANVETSASNAAELIFERADVLLAEGDGIRGAWIRKLELQNPER